MVKMHNHQPLHNSHNITTTYTRQCTGYILTCLLPNTSIPSGHVQLNDLGLVLQIRFSMAMHNNSMFSIHSSSSDTLLIKVISLCTRTFIIQFISSKARLCVVLPRTQLLTQYVCTHHLCCKTLSAE